MNSKYLNLLLVLPIAILLLVTKTNAFEGNDRGNGGDSVVCRNTDGTVKSIEFFDLYEAREVYDMNIEYSSKATYLEKAQDIILRLQNINPHRAEMYLRWLNKFESESKIKYGIELVDISDSGLASFPTGCKLEQTAIQINPELPKDSRYLINGDHWKAMDENSKAALVVHEIILQETAFMLNHFNTRKSRYFNALMQANKIPADTFEMIELAKKIGLQKIDFFGINIYINKQTEISPNEFVLTNVDSAGFDKSVTIPLLDGKLKIKHTNQDRIFLPEIVVKNRSVYVRSYEYLDEKYIRPEWIVPVTLENSFTQKNEITDMVSLECFSTTTYPGAIKSICGMTDTNKNWDDFKNPSKINRIEYHGEVPKKYQRTSYSTDKVQFCTDNEDFTSLAARAFVWPLRHSKILVNHGAHVVQSEPNKTHVYTDPKFSSTFLQIQNTQVPLRRINYTGVIVEEKANSIEIKGNIMFLDNIAPGNGADEFIYILMTEQIYNNDGKLIKAKGEVSLNNSLDFLRDPNRQETSRNSYSDEDFAKTIAANGKTVKLCHGSKVELNQDGKVIKLDRPSWDKNKLFHTCDKMN